MARDVLIVDDSATMRQVVKRTMALAALDVGQIYEAATGIEALAQLAEHEVAVIVLDINMPTMNGIQLLTRMKDNDRLKHISIVVASTEGSAERIAQLVQLGAFGYLRKPFQPEQLRNVLKPLLGVKDHAASHDGQPDHDLF